MTEPQRIRYADVFDRLQRELVAWRRAADGTVELPALPGLRSRTTEDLTLALADAWAVLAEILGFHSARHAAESRLDLASELNSLIELSRLVGYAPDPGLAAGAELAFTVDDAGATPVVTIPRGTAVTSVPAPGQQAVTFETVEAITARASWNLLQPRLTRRQSFGSPPASGPTAELTTLLLAGTATAVAPGDGVLFGTTSGQPVFGVVAGVRTRPDDPPVPGTPARPGWTDLSLRVLPGQAAVPIGERVSVPFAPQAPARGPLLRELSPGGTTTLTGDQLTAAAVTGGFATGDVVAELEAARRPADRAVVFRAQTGIFASSAPPPPASTAAPAPTVGTFAATSTDETLANYPDAAAGNGRTRVFCDGVVRAADLGPAVLRDADEWRIVAVEAVTTRSLLVKTASGRATALTVHAADLSAFGAETTTVFLAGELLPLAPRPVTDPLPPDAAFGVVELDDWVDGLARGQRVAITGMSATRPGQSVAHVSTLHAVRHELSGTGSTSLVLDDPLPDTLLRATVRITANVAAATHGESRSEVLGNADGQQPRPSFTLSGSPLTYLPSGSGSEPALTVYVDGVSRERVSVLLDPDEPGYQPGYVVQQDEQHVSTIQFGAPLPTGVINVRADYRVGLGAAGGSVDAGRLSMLASRPPGVRAVVNPRPAAGGADPETVDDARRNAPVSVRALDRVVSLVDYADFARAFPGIAKASAAAVTIGDRPGVQVTVAGAHGSEVAPGSAVHTALLAGFVAGGDEAVPVRVLPVQRVAVRVAAGLRIDPARIADDVLAAAAAMLTAALSFDARDLGQPVSASEIIAVLQGVPGVLSSSLRTLYRLVGGRPEDSTLYRPLLRADPPAGSSSDAAVLLTLDIASLSLGAIT